MPISQDLPPSTTRAIETVYDEVLHPLLFPPREEHIQPILDSFVNNHDPVLANDTVYTAKARIRETGVELDAVLRECRRIDGKAPAGKEAAGKEGENTRLTLDEVKRMRLRCRLQSVRVSGALDDVYG